jgi:hypothetical protein
VQYTVRVIAAKLITDSLTVSAKSQKEALAKVEQRISSKLKREGYEFELEVLEAVDRARLAA